MSRLITSPRWHAMTQRAARITIVIAALAAFGTVASPAHATCAPSAKLVNPCRPWLGVFGHGYPQVAADLKSQIAYHEQRIGRRDDIVRGNYHVGAQYLTPAEKLYAQRPATILLIDWKPSTDNWAAGDGRNRAVNRIIDAMADSIKSVAPHKIMLAIAHEPENDVSSGTRCDTKATATSGSPADYRSMWANVQRRFAARGTSNVVWVMNYMGFKRWDCLVPKLWPGNGRVDWVMMDPYGSRQQPLADQSVGRFYRYLQTTSDPAHNYLSKPWGLGEFSIHGVTQLQAHAYWDSVKAALDTSKYPKLKAYIVYDSSGGHPDNRVAYGTDGTYDPIEQAHYNAFAQDPTFAGHAATAATPGPDAQSHR